MDGNRERGTREIHSTDEGSGSSGRERPLSPDTILYVVADEHRCAILNAVTNASEKTLEFEVLVDHVADWVGDEDAERASDEHRRRVRIALHHTHLPKLADAGIVDYDQRGHKVRYRSHPMVEEYLDLIAKTA